MTKQCADRSELLRRQRGQLLGEFQDGKGQGRGGVFEPPDVTYVGFDVAFTLHFVISR